MCACALDWIIIYSPGQESWDTQSAQTPRFPAFPHHHTNNVNLTPPNIRIIPDSTLLGGGEGPKRCHVTRATDVCSLHLVLQFCTWFWYVSQGLSVARIDFVEAVSMEFLFCLCTCHRLPRGGGGTPGCRWGNWGLCMAFAAYLCPCGGGNEGPLIYYTPD